MELSWFGSWKPTLELRPGQEPPLDRFTIAGTPEEVAARVIALWEAGADRVGAEPDDGTELPQSAARRISEGGVAGADEERGSVVAPGDGIRWSVAHGDHPFAPVQQVHHDDAATVGSPDRPEHLPSRQDPPGTSREIHHEQTEIVQPGRLVVER